MTAPRRKNYIEHWSVPHILPPLNAPIRHLTCRRACDRSRRRHKIPPWNPTNPGATDAPATNDGVTNGVACPAGHAPAPPHPPARRPLLHPPARLPLLLRLLPPQVRPDPAVHHVGPRLRASSKGPQAKLSRVYIGSTPSPPRRIRYPFTPLSAPLRVSHLHRRQHNGELTQGARKTQRKRPWVMQMIVHGFPSRLVRRIYPPCGG